ncbi:hemolysin [Corallococcus sp. CA047B]|uniref:N,N-dimethylformamidase beta subunit family domain-containing protein n=1 Tax=Corallococcus sp. CA047B TaxID=2316729 RepID=UPI000EA30CE2|nr:N,N-dimethylformamidase beta subunit family domain-containing protein [Corallococcus sp. CA047B]RKH20940.1 hemolysin [Corallococcus sp. CA047B]
MGQGHRWTRLGVVLALLVTGATGCKDTGPAPGTPPPGDRHDEPPLNTNDGGVTPDSDGGLVVPEYDAGLPDDEPDAGTLPDGGSSLPARDADAVHRENQKKGTSNWRITKNANQREIEGYPLQATVTQGESLRVAVSLSEAKNFTWFVYRMGYYGGVGAREVARGGPVKGTRQADCPADPTTGIIACAWSPTLDIPIQKDWVRGVYVVKLVREDQPSRYVPFFVRDANPRSEVAVLIPTSTWAAYNTWGGTSLYDDQKGVMKSHGVARAFQSSYDRPYYRGQGSGHLMLDDLSLVMWLEAQDLDVGYFTDEDMDSSYDFLRGAKVFVMSGHDEYWSSKQRDSADRSLADGRSLLNLGANNAYWQVRYEPAADGRERRIVTCYKGHAEDPYKDQRKTAKFRDLPAPRPENALLGVQFAARWHQWPFPTVITEPNHWVFAGTGLKAGDTLWMANGYEVDQLVNNGRQPAGVEVLAESPSLSLQGGFGFAHMVVRKQGDAYVFSSGGIDFVQKLAGVGDRVADPRAGRIVANVLYKALGRKVPDDLVKFQPPAASPAVGPFAQAVHTVAGEPGKRCHSDGKVASDALGAPLAVAVLPDGGWAVADSLGNSVKRVSPDGKIRTVLTGLIGPMGIAADAQGNIYVADTENAVIRRIPVEGKAEVFAGTSPGYQDGLALASAFNQPAGLSFTPDGTGLLVADLNNGVIRRIDMVLPGNPVTTLQGDWIYRPSAAVQTADGTTYVVESGMARVIRVRNGVTSVVAGSTPGFRDGDPSGGQLLPYLGLALLPDGSLAVSDPGNYRVRRLVFNAAGEPEKLTTLAGSGRYGFADGPGKEAQLVLPAGLAVGPDGTLYVADAGNSLVRAITP